ncbi:RNA polymerase sigma factor [Thermophagus sp. OGC60D27]|uniref:RNA polymerase sigma factor n=1 Tax=Thermophagus sp. OGC60D27 TaxID=3458415 RepID=UPI004037C86B
MEETNETIVIKRVLEGDVQAFSSIVRYYQKPVFSLIVQIVSSKEEAEELTQDVFLKVYKKLNTFRGQSKLSTWIYRIAWNSAISHARKRKIVVSVDDDRLFASIPDESVDELLNKEQNEHLIAQLEKAIGELNPEERLFLSLYYFEDKPVADVAEITGYTTDNVKVKLYRIRKKVVALINKYGDEEG